MRYAIVKGVEIAMGKVGVKNVRYCVGSKGNSIHVDICIPLWGFWKPFVLILQHGSLWLLPEMHSTFPRMWKVDQPKKDLEFG